MKNITLLLLFFFFLPLSAQWYKLSVPDSLPLWDNIVLDSVDNIYIKNKNGIYFSPDKGLNWSLVNLNRNINFVTRNGGSLLGAFMMYTPFTGVEKHDSILIIKSSNNGQTWENIKTIKFNSNEDTWSKPEIISDTGDSFWLLSHMSYRFPTNTTGDVLSYFIYDSLIYNFYVREDRSEGFYYYLKEFSFFDNLGFAHDRIGHLCKSDNKGKDWYELKSLTEGTNCIAISPKTKNIFIGTNNGLYFSIDSGYTWILKDSIESVGNISINKNGVILLICGKKYYDNYDKIKLSYDEGNSWIEIKNYLNNILSVSKIAMNNDDIYINFTGNPAVSKDEIGLFRYRIENKTFVENTLIQNSIKTYQINNNLKFEFTEQIKTLNFKLFNLYGCEIFNKSYSDFNEQNISIQLDLFPKGIYFYWLNIDNKIYQNKLLKY